MATPHYTDIEVIPQMLPESNFSCKIRYHNLLMLNRDSFQGDINKVSAIRSSLVDVVT